MNLTEMEAKVREATNNEPWGAPSTLMAQIAAGTYNYREREEIIGFIFRRFTEKAANEWRQIYKSLQLLDYLIKNGAERLIDDVRANLTLIQMLKSFHYIDSKGRDQGINVRNRAKNLIAFLNDDSMIRSERKKARANAKKFGGVSSAAFGGASSITQNEGFEDGDFTSKVYGDGGVYGERYDDSAAGFSNGQSGASGSTEYEEYDPTPSSSSSSRPTTGSSKVNAHSSTSKPQQPEQDLLGDLLSFDQPQNGNGHSSAAAAPATADDDEDDDFDDFQAAPSQPQKPNFANLYNQQQPQQQQQQTSPQRQPTYTGINSSFNSTGPAKPANNDAFSSLFSSAKTKSTSTNNTTAKKPSTPITSNTSTATKNDDDFFGDFNSGSSNTTTRNNNSTNNTSNNGNSGEVDLLSL